MATISQRDAPDQSNLTCICGQCEGGEPCWLAQVFAGSCLLEVADRILEHCVYAKKMCKGGKCLCMRDGDFISEPHWSHALTFPNGSTRHDPCIGLPKKRGARKLSPEDWRPVKYKRPTGSATSIYLPSHVQGLAGALSRNNQRMRYDGPALFVEGEKKSLAVQAWTSMFRVIGFGGVYSLTGRGGDRAKARELIRKSNAVVVCFDTDLPGSAAERNVELALWRFAAMAAAEQKPVYLIRIPTDGKSKVGIDDYMLDYPGSPEEAIEELWSKHTKKVHLRDVLRAWQVNFLNRAKIDGQFWVCENEIRLDCPKCGERQGIKIAHDQTRGMQLSSFCCGKKLTGQPRVFHRAEILRLFYLYEKEFQNIGTGRETITLPAKLRGLPKILKKEPGLSQAEILRRLNKANKKKLAAPVTRKTLRYWLSKIEQNDHVQQTGPSRA